VARRSAVRAVPLEFDAPDGANRQYATDGSRHSDRTIRLRHDIDLVRASNSGTTAATNPFLLVNTAGTDFRRTDDDFEVDSFRVTASYRF